MTLPATAQPATVPQQQREKRHRRVGRRSFTMRHLNAELLLRYTANNNDMLSRAPLTKCCSRKGH